MTYRKHKPPKIHLDEAKSGIFQYYFSFQGERYRETTGTRDKDEALRIAEIALRQTISRVVSGNNTPERMESQELFSAYNERLTKQGRKKSPATIYNYKQYAKEFLDLFSDTPLSHITRFRVEEWRDTLLSKKSRGYGRTNTLSPKSVKERLEWLSAIYRTYEFPVNPCANVVRPRKSRVAEQKELKFYEAEEMKHLITVAKNTTISAKRNKPEAGVFAASIELLALTGMRSGELRGITVEDIDWDRNTIHVVSDKTDKRRALNLEDESGERGCWYLTYRLLLHLIEKLPKEDQECFGWKGEDLPLDEMLGALGETLKRMKKDEHAARLRLVPYGTTWLYKRLQKLCEKNDIRFMGVHCLRHTFATRAMANPEWTIAYLSQWLGHESIEFTVRRYGHLSRTKRPAFSYD